MLHPHNGVTSIRRVLTRYGGKVVGGRPDRLTRGELRRFSATLGDIGEGKDGEAGYGEDGADLVEGGTGGIELVEDGSDGPRAVWRESPGFYLSQSGRVVVSEGRLDFDKEEFFFMAKMGFHFWADNYIPSVDLEFCFYTQGRDV